MEKQATNLFCYGLHAEWIYKKHPFKKGLFDFSKRVVDFCKTKEIKKSAIKAVEYEIL